MNATANLLPTRTSEAARPSMLRIYVQEARFDFLKMLRLSVYSAATVVFPVMFYVLFGIVFGGKQPGSGLRTALYLLGSYTAFGVVGASLFGFGVGVATERGQGWLQMKRASPMPFSAYIAAKMFTCMTFSVTIGVALMTVGVGFGGVRLSPAQVIGLVAVSALGSVPFCALGLAIGYLAGPNSAPAIVNMIYLPLSFCSGLWIPIHMLPSFLQRLAPFLPPYHLGQLALLVVGYGRGTIVEHVLGLGCSLAAGVALAWYGFQRDEQKMYG